MNKLLKYKNGTIPKRLIHLLHQIAVVDHQIAVVVTLYVNHLCIYNLHWPILTIIFVEHFQICYQLITGGL